MMKANSNSSPITPAQQAAQIKESLDRLFQNAGYTDDDLLEQVECILKENGRLKREVARLRSMKHPQAVDSMPTKLREALRE